MLKLEIVDVTRHQHGETLTFRFEDARQPGYTEKTDIWRIPDILDALLGDRFEAALGLPFAAEAVAVATRKELRRLAKRLDPVQRPNISQVAQLFHKLQVLAVAHLEAS